MPPPMRPFSVIRPEAPMPDTLTKAHGLVALYALQQWEAFAPRYLSDPLRPSYFYTHVEEFLNGLTNGTRKTAMAHLASQTCIACDAPVDLRRTVGDHIIPLAAGGPESVQNSLLLCRPCNSSKGTKDLLEWWLFKDYPVPAFDRTVLCLYCRIQWQQYGETILSEPIPDGMRLFLAGRAHLLPSDGHRIALYGMAYAACALVRWLGRGAHHG